jgi:endonuclease YncB( thermonuclease family)
MTLTLGMRLHLRGLRIVSAADVFNSAMHRLGAVFLALVLAAVIAPAAAQARTGTCLAPDVQALCTVWTGKVTTIGDGDTVYVNVEGDGISSSVSVRITGINAAELSVYGSATRRRGECHAVEATARIEQLIGRSKGRVRLAALDPESHSRNRLRRAVAVKIRGRWKDVGRILVKEGHALWLPSRAEYVWNRGYSLLAARAAAEGRGLWATNYCGPGPSETSPLQIWANWDADGTDSDFVNGEWIKIPNHDPVHEVPLGGWWVRDSQLRRFTFPSWATIAPGDTITVYVGDGPDTWTEFFWGMRQPVFENASDGEDAMGDGVYLFDPEGDLRTWMLYPCRVNCAEPNVGALQITAKPSGREHIDIRNVGAQAIDLSTYRLAAPPYGYGFPRDTVLQPGQEIRVLTTGDPEEDTVNVKRWGETGPILRNPGDTVRVTSYTGIQLACYAWGDRSC